MTTPTARAAIRSLIRCPTCNGKAIITHSRNVSAKSREIYATCADLRCAEKFKVAMAVVGTIHRSRLEEDPASA